VLDREDYALTSYTFADPLGRTVTVAGAFDTELLLWQSEFTATTPLDGRGPDSLRTRSFSVEHAQNHDGWLENTAKATLAGEYSMSGGVLQIWQPADARRQGLARWVGNFHSAAAYLPFQLWENHEFVLGYFDNLQFNDSRDGLVVLPTISSVTINVLDVTAAASGIGLLEVLAPEVGLGEVPAWGGLRLPAGEVWQVAAPDDPEVTDHLIMSSESAVATVTPDSKADLDKCLTFLSQITQLDYQKGPR